MRAGGEANEMGAGATAESTGMPGEVLQGWAQVFGCCTDK